MTMLYRLDAPAPLVGRTFETDSHSDPWNGGPVGPNQFAPVITAGREAIAGPAPRARQPRRMVPRLWGVVPPLSASDNRSHGILTARNLDSPFWIGNLRNSEFRCLVPMSAFMEWGGLDPTSGKRRQVWYGCADQPIFAVAGVWKDSEVPAFALVTCPANAALRETGRETMPVVLPPDPRAHDTWLRGGWDKASALITPYASSMLTTTTR
ncbi:SOS response-associated peptidase [Novosphingobium sp. 1949]|uniref:SOS response-associated peptidase n=1 Tax=Novosphingobium organovorum TaxID=2930092 RepID=A0ABT0BHF4_9SPHN|nr:SOS response-associated peptidase family protein [Novosphingobium organovorum]MCJ2184154.1 SOS response-associated peptidase [Novosphingobium organovorum]